jgi:mRNA-degrading endonuclease toxin of MazEF toxin-antitoxin module
VTTTTTSTRLREQQTAARQSISTILKHNTVLLDAAKPLESKTKTLNPSRLRKVGTALLSTLD